MEKPFKGKAIYNPQGKAGEYAAWACNFYTGCSNNCSYCYLKKGVLSHCWSDFPQLKKCFKDVYHALEIFEKELVRNIDELQKHGLFFSFTTDPMLPETIDMTIDAICFCLAHDVPVKILTKCTAWLDPFLQIIEDSVHMYNKKNLIVLGFTLTGHDNLEKGAASNNDRIRTMRVLRLEGFKTFASIEPIIDLKSSLGMITDSKKHCDLYKIGLMSGRKYDKTQLENFFHDVMEMVNVPVYWKDSFLTQMGINRSHLPADCVNRDYNLFSI